ncbi:MAG: diaminopimelate decarboxylase [Bacillota bacterium]
MQLGRNIEINARGHLEIGGCDTVKLARRFGTPLYVVDEGLVRERCREYQRSLAACWPDFRVAYAGKAFLTMAMCRIMDEEDMWLDVVSGGELYTAVKAGFPPQRILFHGNNKSADELSLALEVGVGRFVCDNFHELQVLARLARRAHARPRVMLRVAPGVDTHTHDYVRTGQVDSKFGFTVGNWDAMVAAQWVLDEPAMVLTGLHSHIGSQLLDTAAFELEAQAMAELVDEIKQETGYQVEELNLGGGLGISYTGQEAPPEVGQYVRALTGVLEKSLDQAGLKRPRLYLEPGRSIVGEAGTTLYTIGAIKHIPGVRTYAMVDGGMVDNPRPALYGAKYRAVVANRARARSNQVVSIAGKCCESGDMLIWDLAVPRIRPGDVLAVFCTGAYNYSMASNYNRLPRPAAVLVGQGEADLIIARERYADLVACDRVPDRLAAGRMPVAAGEGSSS